LFFFSSLQLLDEKKLQETKNLYQDFESPEKAANVYDSNLSLVLIDSLFVFFLLSLKLTHFEKFEDTTQALAAATATVEGKISKPLKKLLKRLVDPDVQDKLLVADSALGKAIKVCLFC
jgi:nucleolar protein 58